MASNGAAEGWVPRPGAIALELSEKSMIFKRLREDLDAFIARDPAAHSRLEVLLCYPGLHALLLHRLSHALWRRRLRLIARLASQFGRMLTGIEIHPGARIGRRLVIDHGQGVVIGETSEIADDVTLYQGVTLGGVAPSVNARAQVATKRHPTLQSGAIVGSGAQILGPITIGDGARIGANSVVTHDVPAGMTAVGIPAHVVVPKDRAIPAHFSAYGTVEGDCPDPLEASIEDVRNEVKHLTDRLAALSERLQHLENSEHANDGASTVSRKTRKVRNSEPCAPVPVDGG